MSLFKWIISQHAVLYTCTVKISHQNLCSCLCEKTIPLWITYYIMLKVKGYIFSQRQVPVAQTTEKWTHKFKSLLIKPIIIRAQRGYINHGTLYYTNLTHTHTHIYTYIHTDTSFTLIILIGYSTMKTYNCNMILLMYQWRVRWHCLRRDNSNTS
jgi:hypothetical protein